MDCLARMDYVPDYKCVCGRTDAMLASVAAMRQVFDDVVPPTKFDTHMKRFEWRDPTGLPHQYDERLVRMIAASFAWHPEYQEGWKA